MQTLTNDVEQIGKPRIRIPTRWRRIEVNDVTFFSTKGREMVAPKQLGYIEIPDGGDLEFYIAELSEPLAVKYCEYLVKSFGGPEVTDTVELQTKIRASALYNIPMLKSIGIYMDDISYDRLFVDVDLSQCRCAADIDDAFSDVVSKLMPYTDGTICDRWKHFEHAYELP